MFEAFILAGGRSSRMGRDKASIEFEGSSLLERTANVLREAGASKVTVALSGETNAQAPEALPVVTDRYSNAGALAGIHAALEACGTELAFVAACDLPFAIPELASTLIGSMDDPDIDCAIAESPDRILQPLFAAFRRENALAAAEEILRDPESPTAVKTLTGRLECRILRFEEYSHLEGAEKALTNVNTPGELQQAMGRGLRATEGD